jgi:biopolymer transport protein ExbD
LEEFAAIARVKVDRAGTIFLNGRPVSLEELREEFSRLKGAHGAVWYTRDDPAGEPPPQALKVIDAIIEARLPVKLVADDNA